MARRRWLSTKISTDGPVNRLAMQHGDFAALFYTWMIPAAGDDGAIWGEPEEILMQVMPYRRDVPPSQVEAVLALLASPEFALVTWDRARRVVRLKPASFRAYQSYITDGRWRKATEGRWDDPPEVALLCGDDAADERATPQSADERRTTPHNSADQRTTAQNAANQRTTPPSSSSSSSLSSGSGSTPVGELVAQGGGGISRAPTPTPTRTHEGRPVPVPPSLEELTGLVADWADDQGIAPDALALDLGRFRDGCILEAANNARPRWARWVPEEWAAAARKWLANPDYGAGGRGGAATPTARRRAPPGGNRPGSDPEMGRDEAKLARSLETIGNFRGGGADRRRVGGG